MTLSVPGERFAPGQPYAPPALKIRLLRRREGAENAPDGRGSLCDGVTLSCGYAGAPAKAYVPLTASDCAGDPQALADALAALGVSGVSIPVPAQDDFFRAMTRAGIGVLLAKDHPLYARLTRHACLCPDAAPAPRSVPSMAEAAWQLCGVAGIPRRPAPDLTPAELLLEAVGRPIDAAEPGAAAVLAWLRALLVRLRAEAARQGRYTGPLCAPGEWRDGDVAGALGTALRPLHLSALPLLGAWWTGTRFSASIVACVPPGTFAQNEPITAVATLEDERGQALAELRAPCPASGGYAGVLEAALPAAPCVLELTARLMRGHTVLEESAMPVYVGERGPLEAAF